MLFGTSHTYILNPRMDIMEVMICQHLYCIEIQKPPGRNLMIVILSNVQNGKIKKGKLPANGDDEIPWNKLCVDLIFTYVIRRK